jgi:small conductance mechanosensitive channel
MVLSTDALTNYSTEALRRVDWKFGIAYGDDVEISRRRLMILLLKTADFKRSC